MTRRCNCIVWVACLAFGTAGALAASPSDEAAKLLQAAGVKGGLVVHLGCGDGGLTAALRASDRYVVHGLEADAAKIRQARRNLHARGLYGKVSVAAFDGRRLPYVDNLVNLVVSDGPTSVPMAEVLRVLAPLGVAMIDGHKTVKPWPKDIDEWSHYLHGPDNNAVAADTRADVPRSIQWVSGPRWGRSHEELASMSAAVSAAGRIFYIVDEAPLASIRFLGDWTLVARDAFNGTLLWKRPVQPWNDHLRHFRSGPVHLPRRLVAAGQRVYVTAGLTSPVVALDAATGKTVIEYKGTERTEEILVQRGVLYLVVGTSEISRRGGGLHRRGEPDPSGFRYVAAVHAESGRRLWRRDFSKGEYLLPLTLAVRGPRLYCQSSAGVVCLDAATGQPRWRTARPTPARRMSFSAPTLVATDEVVLCADRNVGKSEQDAPSAGTLEWGVHGWNEKGFPRKSRCTLRAYAAKDGKELWSAPCSEGYNSPVDLFVIGGTVWVGSAFKGYDLKTGAEKGQIDRKAPRVGMPHHRCYRDKATTRFILTGKSGIEVLSLREGRWLSNNSWIRGTCQYGIMPANGLLYAPPDACACFLTVKSPGFFAAAAQREKTGHMPFPPKPVLIRGSAFAKATADRSASAKPPADTPPSSAIGNRKSPIGNSSWPTYRHDAARSGATPAAVPDAIGRRWSARLGGRLTQPIVAGGKVFVASTDAHTVHALAAADGREVWHFTAGGRIDSSPTAHEGTVLFGSADGWITCLRADDGELAWRFRAAPRERLVCAYGQLESIWPVHGTVLVQNGMLYATAGRSSFLDGGLVLYRLDPATGRELSRTVLYHLDPNTGKQLVNEARFNMEGTCSDILSGDGQTVYLKYFGFDRYGQRTEAPRPHLFAIAGLLGEEWFVRSYWILGAGMPGAGWGSWASAASQFPAGRILCFTDDAVYSYGRQRVASGPVGHRADAYHLACTSRKAPPPKPPAPAKPAAQARKKRRRPRRAPAKPKPVWADPNSLTVRAMVLCGEKLILAGCPDVGRKVQDVLAFENAPEALAAFRGRRGVFLRVVRAADGSKLAEHKLTGLPVFDGMSAADGRLFIALKDGTVECWAAKP